MNVKTMTILIVVSLVSPHVISGDEMPIKSETGEYLRSKGRELMALKHVPEGSGQVTSWVIPDSVRIGDKDYALKFDVRKRDFMILHSPQNEGTVIASGRMTRMTDGRAARDSAFGVMSMTNMPLEDRAQNLKVTNPFGMTNLLHVACENNLPSDRDMVIYKNIYIRISGVTNKLDFAVSLLNAGLPESERISMLPPHP